MNVLEVSGLTKSYPAFTLRDVGFTVGEGRIMGLIGANGAGKTTTLKSLLDLVRPESGSVEMFGLPFFVNERRCKQHVGVVLGEIDFYRYKKVRAIADVTRRFYDSWDETAYRRYLRTFSIDPDKQVRELSSGMRVKCMLALALSHHARLLILDEPTSGLDPVSRDDLTTLFRQLVEDGTRSILFSTHITSDLDKCADDITYIKDGMVVESAEKRRFLRSFDFLKETDDSAPLTLDEIMIRMERKHYDISASV
ncbi:MAG: ABC transporter ATP-binding protein [Sphaerochaetaceae bacterium]